MQLEISFVINQVERGLLIVATHKTLERLRDKVKWVVIWIHMKHVISISLSFSLTLCFLYASRVRKLSMPHVLLQMNKKFFNYRLKSQVNNGYYAITMWPLSFPNVDTIKCINRQVEGWLDKIKSELIYVSAKKRESGV